MKRLTPSSNVVAYTAPPRERAHGRTRRGPAMEYVGIDLHKKESQICLLTETGEVMERRIRTEPQRFAEVLGGGARWVTDVARAVAMLPTCARRRPIGRRRSPGRRGSHPVEAADKVPAEWRGFPRRAGKPLTPGPRLP